MGYYVSCEAEIIFNKKFSDNIKENEGPVLKALEEIFYQVEKDYYDWEKTDDGAYRIFLNENIKYSSDLMIDLYKVLTPFVEEATFEFFDPVEYGENWKHEFKDGKWEEYSGEVVYSDKPNEWFRKEFDKAS